MPRHTFSFSARILTTTLAVMLSLTMNAARGQDFLNFGAGDDASGGFSVADFGVGLPGATANTPLAVEATIAPVPKNAGNVWNVDGKTLVGFVSLKTVVQPDWHIYSATQGEGGLPTKFSDVAVAGAPENATLSVGEFKLAGEIVFEKDAEGLTLEELVGVSDWIAPVYAEGTDAATELAGVTISGQVDALACSNGDGGSCFPQKVPFSASWKDADVAPLLDAIAEKSKDTNEPAREPETQSETNDASLTTSGSAAGELAGPTRSTRGFFALLLTAFFGGLVLNITPCVLPVVGLKILSFFEQAGRSRASAFLLNVWYTVGVLLVFGALAFASVGLSFLFTRSIFQIVMSAIVFIMALSLMGIWELQVPAFLGGERSNKLTNKEGAVGAIFKGIVTTLLAIPCGAPLLSPALDWASEMTRQGQTSLVVVVYLVIGLGMASPFLVAGAFPELLKFFPKPGEWMETFRKTMGFLLLGATLWILYSAPLEYQLPTLAFLFALWFACWNIGRNQYEVDNPRKKLRGWLVSTIVVLIVALFSFNFPYNPIKTTLQSASAAKATRWAIRANRDGALRQDHWSLFDRETLDRELASGRVVAVDFTADWCMNCKFLEKTILHTDEVEAVFDEKNILTLTADWTNQDAQTPDVLAINELLDANGARQVPKLMIFTPDNPDKPLVLSGLYTKSALLEALESIKTK